MNRIHLAVTALAASLALGLTLHSMGTQGAPQASAPSSEPTAYSADEARIPRGNDEAPPPTF